MLKPTVTKSRIIGPGDDGVDLWTNGTATNTVNAIVTSNVISQCDGNGIHVHENGGPIPTPGSAVSIVGQLRLSDLRGRHLRR